MADVTPPIWVTNRTDNDVDRALDPVYRHQLGGLGGIWPEIGVVEVTRAKSALQAAYADADTLRALLARVVDYWSNDDDIGDDSFLTLMREARALLEVSYG